MQNQILPFAIIKIVKPINSWMNGFSMKYEQIIEVKVFLNLRKEIFPPVLIVKSDIVSTHKKNPAWLQLVDQCGDRGFGGQVEQEGGHLGRQPGRFQQDNLHVKILKDKRMSS